MELGTRAICEPTPDDAEFVTSRAKRLDETTGPTNPLRQHSKQVPIAPYLHEFPGLSLKAESAMRKPPLHNKQAFPRWRLQSLYKSRDVGTVAITKGTCDEVENSRHQCPSTRDLRHTPSAGHCPNQDPVPLATLLVQHSGGLGPLLDAE